MPACCGGGSSSPVLRSIRLRSRSVRKSGSVPTPKLATRPQEQRDFGDRIRAEQGVHIRNGERVPNGCVVEGYNLETNVYNGAGDAARRRRSRPSPRGGEGNVDRGRRTDAAYVEGRRSSVWPRQGRGSSLEALHEALQRLRGERARSPSRLLSQSPSRQETGRRRSRELRHRRSVDRSSDAAIQGGLSISRTKCQVVFY
jgi:hypothetical protein